MVLEGLVTFNLDLVVVLGDVGSEVGHCVDKWWIGSRVKWVMEKTLQNNTFLPVIYTLISRMYNPTATRSWSIVRIGKNRS